LAATVSIYVDHGGVDGTPATSTRVDDLGPPRMKLKLADNATIDESDKIIIPTAGNGPYYSYPKSIYLHCDAPDGKVLTNVKLYTSGSNNLGTGCDIQVGLQFPCRYYNGAADVYGAGAGDQYEIANNANELVAEHGGITSSASIFTYTSASPLAVKINSVGAGNQGGQIDAAHETTCYIELQGSVANTASEGTTPQATVYISYDSA